MSLNKSTVKNEYLAQQWMRSIHDLSFGIHTSLDELPSYRIVYFNSQAANVSETIADNATVGYAATTDATTNVAGIVKFGYEEGDDANITYLPGFNRDRNVTVTLLGSMIVEVAPGATITVGSDLGADAEGRATAAGGTGIIALSASTGAGTADKPEYITALVR